jgi:hypothetical protein
MPTLLRSGPYRFFCYAGDRDEPPHLHIERDENEAKFWLDPIRIQSNRGFSRAEINRIQKLVEEHQEELLGGWHDFFNG